jgi:hypothetical protein
MGQAKMSDIVMNKKAKEGGGVSTIVSTPKHKIARGVAIWGGYGRPVKSMTDAGFTPDEGRSANNRPRPAGGGDNG